MRSSKMRSRVLLILLCLLLVTVIITGVYFLFYRQGETVEEQVAEVSPSKTQGKVSSEAGDEDHAKEIRSVIRSIKPFKKPPVFIEDIQVLPRVSNAAVVRAPRVAAATVLEFSAVHIEHDMEVKPIMPEFRVMPVTYFSAPIAGLPEGKAFPPALAAPRALTNGKDIVDIHIRAARGPVRPGSLSIVTKNMAVADSGLADVAQAVTLGEVEVTPLPRGEPGGRVVGRGKDIRGVLRFARVHHPLADWWADQSSLVALTEWLNKQTMIRTDMNVEGGSVRLTDLKLSRCPLVFFTGHDPAMVMSRNLSYGTPIRNRLLEPERDAMRKYLVEDGGFIYFDDCGVNAPAQNFLRIFLAQMRHVMPEYSVDRIPNDHEIYHNYYDMGGPPVGFDIFWWGTHPPKRNFLEGVTVGDHLGVLVCGRDYMCSMEAVSLPTKAVPYSPAVYRFSTNVVIYALTHGGISDYSLYIPEDTTADRVSIKAPTLVPTIE